MRGLAILVCMALCLACGYKADLYLPQQSEEEVQGKQKPSKQNKLQQD